MFPRWRYVLLALVGFSGAASAFEKSTLAVTLPWDADWITAVAFVGPQRVVAGNNLGELLVWDLPETIKGPAPAPVRKLDGHTNVITRLLTTPDQRWLISSSNDHTIRVWDLEAKSLRKETVLLNARAIENALSRKTKPPPPIDVTVDVIEATRVLKGHGDWVVNMVLGKDGQTLISGDEKGEIIVWDLAAGKETRRWKTRGWIYALALAPDGQTLFATERMPLIFDSGRFSAAKLWDTGSGVMKLDLGKTLEKQMLIAACYSPDGKHFAVGRGGEGEGKVSLLDPATWKVRKELTPVHYAGVTDLAFHPDGKHLFSSGRDTTVRIWDVEAQKQVKELGQPRGGQFKDWIHAISIAPGGQRLAAADMAGMVHVWTLTK